MVARSRRSYYKIEGDAKNNWRVLQEIPSKPERVSRRPSLTHTSSSNTRSFQSIFKSISHLDAMMLVKGSRISDEVTVVISNKSKENTPKTPSRRTERRGSDKHSSCSSPQKIWKALSFSPSKKKSKRRSQGTDKENNFHWIDQVSSESSCCNEDVFSVRLTPNTLQAHENRNSPVRKSTFAGDKLARTVIDEKAQHQLAKELRERAQEELESERPMDTLPSFDDPEDERAKEWIELERKKAVAAIWQRKKTEHWERLRAEQLRVAELERQRHLRAIELQLAPSTPKKHSCSMSCVLPSTPKIRNISGRKLAYI